MSTKAYIVVSAYQTDHQRFWSGRRWVTDPSDAETHEQKSDVDPLAFRSARRAIEDRLHYRTQNAVADYSPGARDLVVVENYGMADECVALSSGDAMRGNS